MPWPGPRNLSRPALLAPALVVWLWSAMPAQAAGCHVPERPVLATPLSWERDGRTAAWAMTDDGPVAPHVLTRVPCPGEVPQVPVMTTVNAGQAILAPVEIAPSIGCESLVAVVNLATITPHFSRLDRPPRDR